MSLVPELDVIDLLVTTLTYTYMYIQWDCTHPLPETPTADSPDSQWRVGQESQSHTRHSTPTQGTAYQL